jgi:hypothetical protein
MHSAHPESDFSLMHPQIDGEAWLPGAISYSSLFRMFPLEYRLIAF